MELKTYIAFVEKLIADTKIGDIEWVYLDTQTKFCNAMDFWHFGEFTFDTARSFYTKQNSTHLAIVQSGSKPADLYVIPPTFKNIVVLQSSDLGEYVTRLQNVVASQFPAADTFIQDFLKGD